MGIFNSKILAYHNPEGNYLCYKLNTRRKHSGPRELSFVNSHDDNKIIPGDEWYLIHANWLNSWLEFVQNTSSAPGRITNDELTNIVLTPKGVIESISLKSDIKNKVGLF